MKTLNFRHIFFTALLATATLSSCASPSSFSAAPNQPLTLDNYVLTGHYAGGEVTFTLHAKAHAPGATGEGEIPLLAGAVSLTGIPDALSPHIELRDNVIYLKYADAGVFPIDLPFRAKVGDDNGWKTVTFTTASANIRQLTLEGWPPDAKLELPDASQPVTQNGQVKVNLPGAGPVQLRWKETPPEATGKLFFSAEGAIVDTVAPGILRQTDQIALHVLQGKLEKIQLDLRGDGEVTRVEGQNILNWAVSAGDTPGLRHIDIQLNAPQTGEYALALQLETPLPALPATAEPPRLSPAGASSYGGRLRVQNEGAVRLEVKAATGLSQIAPEQFPVNNGSQPPPTQAFAYRFADTGYTYSVSADNVLPELNVTGVMVYHLGESDASVDAEIDLDIREAPLRDLNLSIPADWSVSTLEAPNYADHFVTPTEAGRARLHVIFGQPLAGRQVVHLRLVHNSALDPAAASAWQLPPINVENPKSSRGFVGVTSDPGLRLTTTTSDGLTEAPSSFPIKVDNLQAAWRFEDAPWSATLKVERLTSTVQADAIQIFSVGEGLAYGSTVLNLNIAGAPINMLKLQNTGGYRNVEFTGRDQQAPKQTGDTFEIDFNHPISGAYTMLVTYELPFKVTGDTLAFTGMKPLDVQSEQGHIVVTSSHAFSLTSAKVSDNLTRLETAEIPTDYRLLSDAPILACYQYSARPFDASLVLKPLATGSTIDQVVDIAELNTHVSSTGEVMTLARYALKSKGHDHLQLTLPKNAKLWSVSVAGSDVVPIADQTGALLIPLPRQGDPDKLLLVEVKYADGQNQNDRVTLGAPALRAPSLVTDWTITADEDHQLQALDGAPVIAAQGFSGLDWLGQVAFGTGITSSLLEINNDNNRLNRGPATNFPDEANREHTLFWMGLLLASGGIVMLRVVRDQKTRVKIPGLLAGAVLWVWGVGLLVQLGNLAADQVVVVGAEHEVRMSIPVVEGGRALSYSFANEPAPKTAPTALSQGSAWLLLPGLLLIAVSRRRREGWLGYPALMLGVIFVLSGALGLPQGPWWFCVALSFAFTLMGLRLLLSLRGQRAPHPLPRSGAAAATAAVVALLLWIGPTPKGMAADVAPSPPASTMQPAPKTGLVLSIGQTGTVKDGFATLQAKVIWRAEKGDQLVLLGQPAVLTAFDAGKSGLNLTQQPAGDGVNYVVTANADETYRLSFAYEIRAAETGPGAASLSLPTPGGLVNEVTLDLDQPDLEAGADTAVALHSDAPTAGGLHLTASFPAGAAPALRWSPRARDLQAEKPVYYAEWRHLYAPAAGLVEGRHEVQIRLSQGEVKELAFSVPAGLTISQVDAEGLTSWRFDPDKHKLMAYFEPARKGVFVVVIHSQATASPLPYDTTLAPLSLDGATGELGLLAAATGSDVQLDSATPDGMAPANIDDFPASVVQAAAHATDPLTVRRAYSYNAAAATLKIKAVAVEPDVHVDTLQTLSLGEDRITLAARFNVIVNRAGIFKLSFVLPKGFDLESLTGPQLSQWTKSVSDGDTIITLNLKGKTTGNSSYDVTLSSPGLTTTQSWTVPRLSVREASKQTGKLAILPELGLRPQIQNKDGVTQINASDAGINRDDALVFSLLQSDWTLAFDVQKIAPSIQTTVLQEVTVSEGLTSVHANLAFDIQNAGVRELRVQVPAAATGVHITGPMVSDSKLDTQPDQWVVTLQRRAIGAQNLEVTYQLPPPGADNKLTLTGIRTLDTSLQRGYLAIRARGRLETRVTAPPPELQVTDWESVPSTLRRNFDSTSASQTYRVEDPAFTLPVEVARHEAAEVLPAQVLSASLRSLVSANGELLTTATVRLMPGDKRNLKLTLPKDAVFWFAFVNDKGVTPSVGDTNKDEILLPLEQHPIKGEPTTVEFFYQQALPAGGLKQSDLAGPSFDLPLENISWQLYLPDSWQLDAWSGPWQKTATTAPSRPAVWNSLNDYVQTEKVRESAQTDEARKFLDTGNQLLQQGQQVQARDLFNNAYQISQQDAAFNEDARVQYQNLRETQAMVALNNSSNSFANGGGISKSGAGAAGGGGPSAINNAASAPQTFGAVELNPVLSQSELLNFTDQQARKILGTNSAQDNDVLARLAARLVQQQANTLPHPVAIHATLPERGKIYEFTQSLLANPGASLSLKITAGPSAGANHPGLWALALLTMLLAITMAISRQREARA